MEKKIENGDNIAQKTHGCLWWSRERMKCFCDFRAASLASSKRLPQCEKSCSSPDYCKSSGKGFVQARLWASFRTAWVLPF